METEKLICNKCKTPKERDEFNNSKTRKTGKRSYCKTCERQDAIAFYKKNPEPYKKRANRSKKKVTDYYQSELVRVKKESGCILCPENEPCALDFHHIDRTEKDTRVRTNMGYTELVRELKKCIIVCANCHRKIHAGLIQPPTQQPDINIVKYPFSY